MTTELPLPQSNPQAQSGPRILALVAARGGSKRLPGKNIRFLGGKPLIAWTIDLAVQSQLFCDVLVSTDDQEIADVAIRCGALVPWLRPAELATDTANSVDVALHAIDWYETNRAKLDGVMFLQPTSPFRTMKTLKESLTLFLAGAGRPVVSVTPALSHPAWCFTLQKNGLVPFLGWEEANKRSQDLESAFVMDGSIYITTPETLRTQQTFLTANTIAYVVNNPDEALDIDTSEDWMDAETIYRKKIVREKNGPETPKV